MGRGTDEAFEQHVVSPLLSDILPSIYHSALGSGAFLLVSESILFFLNLAFLFCIV